LRDRPEGWDRERINLITGYDDRTQLADIAEKLDELKQSLLELDVELEVKLNPNMHDREIRIDNGWVIKIGRGWTSSKSLAAGSR